MRKKEIKKYFNEFKESILIECNDEWFSEKQLKRLSKILDYNVSLLVKGFNSKSQEAEG